MTTAVMLTSVYAIKLQTKEDARGFQNKVSRKQVELKQVQNAVLEACKRLRKTDQNQLTQHAHPFVAKYSLASNHDKLFLQYKSDRMWSQAKSNKLTLGACAHN